MSIVPEVVPGLQQYLQSTVTTGDDAKDAALCESYICSAIRPKDIDKQVVPMPAGIKHPFFQNPIVGSRAFSELVRRRHEQGKATYGLMASWGRGFKEFADDMKKMLKEQQQQQIQRKPLKRKQQKAINSQRSYRKSKGRENWTAADIAADAADAENLLAAKEAVKAAAAAADPKKAKRQQQQVIWSARAQRKKKGIENWTAEEKAAAAADAENLLAAPMKAAAAAAAADPKEAKRKQQKAIRNKRSRKKAKARKNSTETTQSVFMV